MNEIDIKIFEFIDFLKSRGDIRFDTDFCRAIDMHKQRLYAIRKQNKHFTTLEIKAICKAYKLNANAIFNDDPDFFYSNIAYENAYS